MSDSLPISLQDLLHGIEGFTPEELQIMYLVGVLGSIKKTAAHIGSRRDHVGKIYRQAQEKHAARSRIRETTHSDTKLSA